MSDNRTKVDDFFNQIKTVAVVIFSVWLVATVAVLWFLLNNQVDYAIGILLGHIILVLLIMASGIGHIEREWRGYSLLSKYWTRRAVALVVLGVSGVFLSHHLATGAIVW